MKEEILNKFQFEFAVMLERSLYSEDELEKVYKFISKSLEDYADWKIKECLPEKLEDKPHYCPESSLYKICLHEEYINKTWNACIDQILTNKDKIK